jgi:hypothetical protein
MEMEVAKEREVIAVEEGQEERTNVLKLRLLKFLRVCFPQAFFGVEVKNGHGDDFVVKIKTSLISTSEKTKKMIMYFEEKFEEEGLTEAEFEKLLCLKRTLKKDHMMRQEIKRVLLYNGILTQEEAKNLLIEGFEVSRLLESSSSHEL